MNARLPSQGRQRQKFGREAEANMSTGSFARRTAVVAAALVVALVATLVALPPAMAQQDVDPPGRVGRLARLSGTVSFHTADQQQWDAATLNYPVTGGSAVWTEPGSRAAVQIGYNSLELDSETELDVMQLDDTVFAATLAQGSVYVILRNVEQGEVYVVDTPRGRVTLDRPGRYEIVGGDERRPTRVIVFDGQARVSGDNLDIPVPRGTQLYIDGAYPQLRTSNGGIGQPDAFAAWVMANVRDPAPPPPVVQGMTGVQDLGNYGQWDSAPEYGQVWYPTVPVGWAPYREGRWVWVHPWGWTWVAAEPWGFAPFHYGRWVEIRGRWAWTPAVVIVPGRHYRPIYAPALVTFFGNVGRVGVGIGVGPVGWVPLAPYEVYRPYYRTSPRYVQNINVVYVRNVTNITIVNDRDRHIDQYANRRGFTSVAADVMRGSRPIRGSEHKFDERDVKNWRVSHVDDDVKPGRNTIGVTPDVARRFNIDKPDDGRHAPGPKIDPSRFSNAQGNDKSFKKFDGKTFTPGANVLPNGQGQNGTNGPNNDKGDNGKNDKRFVPGPRTPGSPVHGNGVNGNGQGGSGVTGQGNSGQGNNGQGNNGKGGNSQFGNGDNKKTGTPGFTPNDRGVQGTGNGQNNGQNGQNNGGKPEFKKNFDRPPGGNAGGSSGSGNGSTGNGSTGNGQNNGGNTFKGTPPNGNTRVITPPPGNPKGSGTPSGDSHDNKKYDRGNDKSQHNDNGNNNVQKQQQQQQQQHNAPRRDNPKGKKDDKQDQGG